jgi:PII-like signaling protein
MACRHLFSPGTHEPGVPVNCIRLRFYTHERQTFHMVAVHVWLLLLAHRLSIVTAAVTRSMTGFDRFCGANIQHVEELACDPAVIVELIASEVQETQLLDLIAAEGLQVAYTRHAIEYHEIPGV